MQGVVYLSIACDIDQEGNPPYHKVINLNDIDNIWQGIVLGISEFRLALRKSNFFSKYGPLRVSWLLRADRMIKELYGEAAFCFRRFETVWHSELEYGSEIGWHPHLYRWESRLKRWVCWLGQDEDLEMLAHCLYSLRQYADIKSVRTGWDYHSNRLMRFFDDQELLVDASAVPNSIKTGVWFHNWEGTPFYPYHPSAADYRRPAKLSETSLNIMEMPVLVRALRFPLPLMRFFLRKIRQLPEFSIDDYESARWQCKIITQSPKSFCQAVRQSLKRFANQEAIFLNTFFHTYELLSFKKLKIFIYNLESLARLVEQAGYILVPMTLFEVANIARNNMAKSNNKK